MVRNKQHQMHYRRLFFGQFIYSVTQSKIQGLKTRTDLFSVDQQPETWAAYHRSFLWTRCLYASCHDRDSEWMKYEKKTFPHFCISHFN